jgi:hypothetical protein
MQDLEEQAGEGLQMPLAELSDAVVVRLLISRQHPERDIFPARLLDLARRESARAVPIDEELRHHRRVIGRIAPSIHSPVDPEDFLEIHRIDDITDEESQVLFRKPFPQVQWKQIRLIKVIGSKGAHTAIMRE